MKLGLTRLMQFEARARNGVSCTSEATAASTAARNKEMRKRVSPKNMKYALSSRPFIKTWLMFFLIATPLFVFAGVPSQTPEQSTPEKPTLVVQIDSSFRQGEKRLLRFWPSDVGFKLDHYEVSLAGKEWRGKEGFIVLEGEEVGVFPCVIRAFSTDGDILIASRQIEVLPQVLPVNKTQSLKTPLFGSGWEQYGWYVTGGAITAIFLLVRYLWKSNCSLRKRV